MARFCVPISVAFADEEGDELSEKQEEQLIEEVEKQLMKNGKKNIENYEKLDVFQIEEGVAYMAKRYGRDEILIEDRNFSTIIKNLLIILNTAKNLGFNWGIIYAHYSDYPNEGIIAIDDDMVSNFVIKDAHERDAATLTEYPIDDKETWDGVEYNLIRRPGGYGILRLDLPQVLDRNYYPDVKIIMRGQSFNAHRVVLATMSTYFSELFKLSDEKKYVLDIDPNVFSYVLDLMYGKEILMDNDNIIDILKATFYYDIEGINYDRILDYIGHRIKKEDKESYRELVLLARPKL